MTTSTATVLVAVMLAVVVLPSAIALGDGKYFPEKVYKVPPAIPAQRAILVYRDGTEKLTIESSLDGKGQEFGWIIPLPSRPTEFAEVSPGLIKTLDLAVQPHITHERGRELASVGAIVLVVTLLCVIGVMIPRPWRTILLLMLILFLIPHLLSVRMAGGGSVPTAGLPGIQVHEVREIGSYELAVLEADSAEALDRWLTDGGFAGLGASDKTVVSDYVREGWCFVAAKLRREGHGYSRPHPLSMSFATKVPVYPMRLTATAGSDVYLDLFVVADKRAACKALTLEVVDTYAARESNAIPSLPRAPGIGFLGAMYRQEIGHPGAAEQLWDGCTLSRLCGRLRPEDMQEDITLQFGTNEPYQARYFSRRGARETALIYSSTVWSILLIPLSVFIAVRRSLKGRVLPFLRIAVAPALAASLLVWTVVYAMLPKVGVAAPADKAASYPGYDHLLRRIKAIQVLHFAEAHEHFGGQSKEEIARLLAEYYASGGTENAFTGKPIKHEDSPGNYTLLEDERGIVWRVYSLAGYPDECVLTSPSPWRRKDGRSEGNFDSR